MRWRALLCMSRMRPLMIECVHEASSEATCLGVGYRGHIMDKYGGGVNFGQCVILSQLSPMCDIVTIPHTLIDPKFWI